MAELFTAIVPIQTAMIQRSVHLVVAVGEAVVLPVPLNNDTIHTIAIKKTAAQNFSLKAVPDSGLDVDR